jgi:hypothetical protein
MKINYGKIQCKYLNFSCPYQKEGKTMCQKSEKCFMKKKVDDLWLYLNKKYDVWTPDSLDEEDRKKWFKYWDENGNIK